MGWSAKRNALQGYFAGIFDGEGHVGIQWNGSTYGLRAAIQMDDPQALLLLWREYGDEEVKFYVRRHIGTGKIFYRVEFRHYRAYRFLKEILPFTVIKHEQVKVGLSFIVHRRKEHQDKHVSNCPKCQHYDHLLKEIRARDKRVNTVNALLEHEMREYRAKREDVELDVALMTSQLEKLLEGVETRDRTSQSVEPTSALEQEIVQSMEGCLPSSPSATV